MGSSILYFIFLKSIVSKYNMGNCLNYIIQLFQPAKIHKILNKKVKQLKLLAEGGYGYVVLVQDTQTKIKYAMKKIICQTQEQRALYDHQVNVMKQLSHCDHVVKYFGAHQIQRDGFFQSYILMQLGQKTLYDLLVQITKRGQSLLENQIVTILKQIAMGLQQMHQANYTHRDVKVQNILFVQGKAKLCDLGSATTQKVDLKKIPKNKMYQYQQRFQKYTTLMYRPPEMIDLYLQYPVDQRVDTWMLGCVVYVMNYGYHPFQQEGKLSIVNASIKYPKTTTDKMQNFMRNLLTPNPQFRPKMKQVINTLNNWQRQDIKLNEVAKIIKQNEQYEKNGEYDKIRNNQWRRVQYHEQWQQFQHQN